MANWVKFQDGNGKPVTLNLDRAIIIQPGSDPAKTKISFERGENPQAVIVMAGFEDVTATAKKTNG